MLHSAGISLSFIYDVPTVVSRIRNRKSTSSPVLASGNFTHKGRTLSQVAIASPTIRSTGFVKEVLVLFTGTSSMQTASAGRPSPLLGTVTSSLCQRMQPTRRRRTSLLRRQANSQVRASALPRRPPAHGPAQGRRACRAAVPPRSRPAPPRLRPR